MNPSQSSLTGERLTCDSDGEVAEQQVVPGEPTRVNAGIFIRHVDDAQDPLGHVRPVVWHDSCAVFEPEDRLWGAIQVTWHLQGVPQTQNVVLQVGCLTRHRVWGEKSVQFLVSPDEDSGDKNQYFTFLKRKNEKFIFKKMIRNETKM